MTGSLMGFACALTLAIGFAIADAQSVDTFDVLVHKSSPLASEASGAIGGNGKLCQLCEQYSTEALQYLQQNETQTEILSILHRACAGLAPLRQQCITLVDYYIPVFFLEVSAIDPEEFCESMHLCKKGMMIRLPTQEDACSLCHYVVVEVLTKLKDPDTQMDVLELLLKTCNKADSYAQQCKRLVLEYAPLILVNAEKFLETMDVCSAIRACKTSTQVMAKLMPLSAAA